MEHSLPLEPLSLLPARSVARLVGRSIATMSRALRAGKIRPDFKANKASLWLRSSIPQIRSVLSR